MTYLRNILLLVLLGSSLIVSAQTPQNIQLQAPNGAAPRACPDRNAGTVSLGEHQGLSNDITLTRSFLCLNDRLNFIHNGDAEVLDSDPDPSTTPGVGYIWYTCPPTVQRSTLADIQTDGCLLLDPMPAEGAWLYVDNLNGDALFQNSNQINGQSIPDFFNQGEPIELWFAPFTIDAVENGQPVLEGNPSGPCVHSNTDAAFSIVYLTPIVASNRTVVSDGAGGCLGSFDVFGGLPQFDGSTYSMTATLASDPSVTGTFTNSFSHGEKATFSFPQPGTYNIVIEDGKSCGHSFSMDVSCLNGNDPIIFNISSDIVNMGDIVTTSITLDDFASVGAVSFELRWDPTVLEFDSHSNFLIGSDGFSSFNAMNAGEGRLIVIWLSDDLVNGSTEPDGTTYFTIDFRAIGECGRNTDITMENRIVVNPLNAGLLHEVNPGNVRIQSTNYDANVDVCPDDGSNTGTMRIQMCGGVAPYQVSYIGPVGGFDNVSTQDGVSIIAGLPAGSYDVSITDDNGDIINLQIDIPAGSIHDVNINIHNLTCFNAEVVALDVQPAGSYDIQWSTGVFNTDTLRGLDNGQYSVTVTNDAGCQVVHPFTLNYAPILIEAVIDTPTCNTSTDGSIRISATGGVADANGHYTIKWEGQDDMIDSTSTLSNLGVGQYTVTVTDVNNCSTVETFTLSSSKRIILDHPPTIEHLTCNGDMNGFIGFSVSTVGATNDQGYLYEWELNNTPVSSQFGSLLLDSVGSLPPGLSGGIYRVTITDFDEDQTCVLDTFFEVFEPEPIQVEVLEITPTNCNGDDGRVRLRVTGGDTQRPNNAYFIDWSSSNPGNQQDENLRPGDIHEQDNLAADTFFFTVFQAYSSTMGGDTLNLNCFLDSFIVIPGEEGPMIVQYDSVSVGCGGGADGELQVFYTPPNGSVAWSDEDGNMLFGDRITGLTPGDYYVTVTSSPGCSTVDTVTLAEGTDITLDSVVYRLPTCPNSGNGAITIFASGPGSDLEYEWDHPNGSNNPTLPSVPVGTYSVTITVPGGDCPPLIIDTLTVRAPEIFDVTFSNVVGATCIGICDGSAQAAVMGGGGPINLDWGNGETTPTATALCAGLNILTVDDGLCIDTFHLDIPAADSISLMAQVSSPRCAGEQNGTIELSPSGSNPPFIITWEDGPMGPDRMGLDEGQYISTIVDQQGCSRIDTFDLTVPDALDLSIDPDDFFNITCAERNDGRVIVTVEGGTGDYTFSWTNNVSTTSVAQNLGPGSYAVTVTDEVGCMDDTSFTMTEPAIIEFRLGAQSEIACFGEQATFSVDSAWSGSGGPYTYTINNGAIHNVGDEINLFGGTYVLTIIDQNGCFIERDVTIIQPEEISVDIGDDITVTLGDSVDLGIVSFQGGFPIDSMIWVSAGSDLSCVNCPMPNIKPTEESMIMLTIIDSTGCLATDEMIVFVDATRKVYIPNAFSPNDDGINDVFQVFTGKGVERISSMQLFNRWGGQVFGASNIDPDRNGTTGWNGTSNGNQLDPGVYVYVIQVEFSDGKVITYKGDVTLVR